MSFLTFLESVFSFILVHFEVVFSLLQALYSQHGVHHGLSELRGLRFKEEDTVTGLRA